jgi:hypothetical protein
MSAEYDTTSLGAILVSMGVITEEELTAAVEFQWRSSMERLLGNQLVVMEVCSKEQVDEALRAQEKMRSGKYGHAVAVADIALARKKRMQEENKRFVETTDRVVKKVTGMDHPAISPPMLAKPVGAK